VSVVNYLYIIEESFLSNVEVCMGRAKTTKKAASRISKKVEDRIAELALKNPDFGARRLVPLLNKERGRWCRACITFWQETYIGLILMGW
jgi:hypothetical protein